MNIVLTEGLGIPQALLNQYTDKLEAAGHTFRAYAKTGDVQALSDEIRDADVIILANMPLPGAALKACTHLKFIDVAFTGVDHVDLAAAKAAGAVVNGYSRDTKGILALDFPCFSYGPYAQDQAPRGKVIDYRVPIEMEGVRINDGDILVGDIDGVCVVPREIEEEVFTRALEKARGERMVLKKIQEGMKARDAFDTYGIM